MALAADAVALLTLPLALQRAAVSGWLSLHWAGISNLWRKLYRPAALREAAAAPVVGGRREPYRVERLTVGALLLTPLLLLAPTLLAFGALVAALSAVPLTVRAALRALPASVRVLSWGEVVGAVACGSCRAADAWFQPLAGTASSPVLRLHFT